MECDEDSISINISLIASSWADHVTEGIHQLLWSKEEWRESMCFQNPQEARSKVTKLLSRLKDDISEVSHVIL